MSLDALKWNDAGLVLVVAQDAETGEIRMVAYANREALERTLETGVGHFYSRSRASLWKKGESSGNTLAVREVWVDCDKDAVLYLVDPKGPSCHTGAETCFFTRLDAATDAGTAGATAAPTLLRLERTLRGRTKSSSAKSYTKSLLAAGADKIGAKLREEAEELSDAVADESDERVVSEGGDVLYHMMVGLLFRGVPLRDVLSEISRRFGQSGHDEKRSR